nr:heme ABC exporter ATP-binding protein CcmA [Ameyamaea chiangmaiensis]
MSGYHDTPPTSRLQACELSVFRGERLVLDDISLSLAPGEAMILHGANGSGKSTLLRVLAGLRQADGGHVLWAGSDIAADRAAHASRVAYLGHQDALKPGLTLRENLHLACVLADTAPDEAIDAFALQPLADLPARLLSAGQKRRTALARVAVSQRPLWLLDEPTLGLDTHAIERFGHVMADHRTRGGVIVATTHVPLPLDDTRSLVLPDLAAFPLSGGHDTEGLSV